jgi:4-hydroxy-2-oxoglutarate aldolase
MVLTPHAYRGRMDGEALQGHYARVAAAAPVPLFVYHMPDITGLDLSAELLTTLVRLPNVWGFKDSSTQGGPLAGTLTQVRTLGFVGSGARFLQGLEAGAVGGILAIANLIPELCVSLYSAWEARKLERASELQARATAVVQALRGWGVAGVKAALADRGGIDVGPPREPLRLPSPEVRRAVAAAIDAARQVI